MARAIAREIRAMLSLAPEKYGKWVPPVLTTVATRGEGVEALLEAMEKHREYLKTEGLIREKRAERVRMKIRHRVEDHLRMNFWVEAGHEAELERHTIRVLAGEETPYRAAEKILGGAEAKRARGTGHE